MPEELLTTQLGPPRRVVLEFEDGTTLVLTQGISASLTDESEYIDSYELGGGLRTRRVLARQQFSLVVSCGNIEITGGMQSDAERVMGAMANVAAQTALSIEEVASAFARLGQAGMSFGTSLDSMRAALKQLRLPTEEQEEELEPPQRNLVRVIRFLKEEDDGDDAGSG
jgi:hypothetical protein